MAQTTISVAAGADDGYVYQESTAYGGSDGAQPVETGDGGWTVNNRKTGFGGTAEYNRSNFICRFDTSVIPDGATITAAALQVKTGGFMANDDSRSLQIEWITDPGTITFADFNATPAATAKAATALSGLATTTAYEWSLLSPNANINKSGYTGLRFHVDGGAPAGNNYIGFYQVDHATEPEPKLVVTYNAPPYTNATAA